MYRLGWRAALSWVHMNTNLKDARDVATAPIVATGLLGGWLIARETGIRPIGGALLAAAGAYATRSWVARSGGVIATGLLGLYVASFGLSHPLAKKIGAWPSVLTVTAASAGAAYLLNDHS